MTRARTIADLKIATELEAETASDNEKYLTPLRMKNTIDANAPRWIETAEMDLTNGGANDLQSVEWTGIPAGVTDIEVFVVNADDVGGTFGFRVGVGAGPTWKEAGYWSEHYDQDGTVTATTYMRVDRNEAILDGVAVFRKGDGNEWFMEMNTGEESGAGRIDLGVDEISAIAFHSFTSNLNGGTAMMRYK